MIWYEFLELCTPPNHWLNFWRLTFQARRDEYEWEVWEEEKAGQKSKSAVAEGYQEALRGQNPAARWMTAKEAKALKVGADEKARRAGWFTVFPAGSVMRDQAVSERERQQK